MSSLVIGLMAGIISVVSVIGLISPLSDRFIMVFAILGALSVIVMVKTGIAKTIDWQERQSKKFAIDYKNIRKILRISRFALVLVIIGIGIIIAENMFSVFAGRDSLFWWCVGAGMVLLGALWGSWLRVQEALELKRITDSAVERADDIA